MTHPKTAKKLQLNIAMKKSVMGTFRTNTEMWILSTNDAKKTIKKGGIILRQAVDNLIKIKHGKDMTAGEMKNQTHRNCITSILPPHMSELGKKVPDDSDWLFGDNIVSRINQIKAKQPAL